MNHQTDHPPCPNCFQYWQCRCEECWREVRRYKKRWRAERLKGRTRLVDAGPSRERVEFLTRYGMTVKGIARDAGIGASTVKDLLTNRDGRPATVKVLARTEAALLALRFRPGRTGQVPAAGASRRLRDLALRGYTVDEVAAECGVAQDTIARLRRGQWDYIKGDLHETVREVYERLYRRPPSLTDPAQQGRVRRLAEGKGWVPLAKYDDPENPREVRYRGSL